MKLSKFYKSSLASTRTRLNLSQQQLAQHLGISKASIGMAETGRRKLPVAALIKLAELEIKMTAVLPAVASAQQNETNIPLPAHTKCESLLIREMQGELEARKLSAALDGMQEKQQRLQTQLLILDKMIENEPAGAGKELSLWLQLHLHQVLKQLVKCSPVEQSLLRNKIALLNAELHLNRSVRQQMNDQTGT